MISIDPHGIGATLIVWSGVAKREVNPCVFIQNIILGPEEGDEIIYEKEHCWEARFRLFAPALASRSSLLRILCLYTASVADRSSIPCILFASSRIRFPFPRAKAMMAPKPRGLFSPKSRKISDSPFRRTVVSFRPP